MSLYDRLGLPSSIAATLFLVALAFFLSPYLGGQKIAGQDIPSFGEKPSKLLKWLGWIPVVVALIAFAPIYGPTTTITVRAHFQQPDSTAGCRLSGTDAVLRVDTNTYRARIGRDCSADFTDVAKSLIARDARVGLGSSSPYVIASTASWRVDPSRALSVIVEDTATAPRLNIAMLAFEVPDAVTRAQFVQFREALRTGIQNLPGVFGDGPSLGYVKRLELEIDSTSVLNSNAEMGERWDRTHALQLLRGHIDPSRQPVVVAMSVWLGALAPTPTFVSLPLTMAVTPDAFANNRNGYSLVTLYALARDARRRGMPSDVVAAILAKANAIRPEIVDPRGELTPVLVGIDSMLAQVSRGTP